MADLNRIAEIRDLPLTAGPGSTSVAVGEGSCFLPSGRRIMTSGTSATLAANQPVGWIHAYGFESPNNTLALELSSTAPDAPYRGSARTKSGDVTRRYLGSGRVETVGKLRAGRHLSVAARGNRVLLDQSTATFQTPPRALSLAILALQQPALQTLNLSPYVPLTAVAVDIKISNMSNLWVYLSRPAQGNPSATNRAFEVSPNTTTVVPMALDSDLTVLLQPSATPLIGSILTIAAGNVVAEIVGYYFNR